MVEYVSIGSLLTRKRDKAKKIGGEAPVYAVTNDKGFVLSSDLHDFTIHSEDTANYMVVEKNDFAYNPSRLNIGSIAYFKNDGKGLISPMYVVFHADEKRVLPEYLFIAIKSEAIRNKIDSLKEEGARFRFDFKRWDLIQIPIPSLSEQTHIVGILDTFTAAIENLKQQIVQRRKQYEHYRDQLLDLEGKEGVEMKTLGEVCNLITGGEVPDSTHKGQLQPTEDYPYAVYTNGKEVYGFSSTYQVDADTVCISSIGANTGAIFYKTGRFTPAIRLKVLLPKEGLLSKYLFYACSKIDFRGRNTGSVPNINADYVKGRKLFVPSLTDQQRIVSILDTFEQGITNLEQQLKLREKQYEFYRNKLLTFE